MLGRIFLTQQVQVAGAASDEDYAMREPICSRAVAERVVVGCGVGLFLWGFFVVFPKYMVKGRFSTLLAFHKCSSPNTSRRLLHAALCVIAGKCKQFQHRFPRSYVLTKAAFQCEFPRFALSLM